MTQVQVTQFSSVQFSSIQESMFAHPCSKTIINRTRYNTLDESLSVQCNTLHGIEYNITCGTCMCVHGCLGSNISRMQWTDNCRNTFALTTGFIVNYKPKVQALFKDLEFTMLFKHQDSGVEMKSTLQGWCEVWRSQGRRLCVFKVFNEYRLNLGSRCISMFYLNLTFDKTLINKLLSLCLCILTVDWQLWMTLKQLQ